MLYPFKFNPIIKEKIWGGKKLSQILNKQTISDHAGESWEISCVKGDLSIVSNGFLKGESLKDLISKYKEELVGSNVFKQFGVNFPLLIKFIDAADDLSVQVHPNDQIAKVRHNENGKTEIWYIIDTDEDARLILGVNTDLKKEQYVKSVSENKIQNILNSVYVKSGDVAYIPAGRIHAIGKGVLLAEIQQSSDITYRIFDWNRKDLDGSYRDLHTDLAVDVVELERKDSYLTAYENKPDKFSKLADIEFFKVNIIHAKKPLQKDYNLVDSFIIYMLLEGEIKLEYSKQMINITKGETVLIPASIKDINIVPIPNAKFLEIHM